MKARDLKVGDKFLLVSGLCSGDNDGRYAVVIRITPKSTTTEVYYDIFTSDNRKMGDSTCEECISKINITLLSTVKQNNTVGNIMQSLKSIYSRMTLVEPNKSRQAAGIYDSDNMPTDDGDKIITKWLLENNPNVADFDAKVVAPIVSEMEKNCK